MQLIFPPFEETLMNLKRETSAGPMWGRLGQLFFSLAAARGRAQCEVFKEEKQQLERPEIH